MPGRGAQRGALLSPADKRVRRGGVEPSEADAAAGCGERAPARGSQRILQIQKRGAADDVVCKPGRPAAGNRPADFTGSAAGGREVILLGVAVIGVAAGSAIVVSFPVDI